MDYAVTHRIHPTNGAQRLINISLMIKRAYFHLLRFQLMRILLVTTLDRLYFTNFDSVEHGAISFKFIISKGIFQLRRNTFSFIH